MTDKIEPDVIARQSDPIERSSEPDAFESVRDQLLSDLRDEARRAGWPDDFEVTLIMGDADLSTNRVVLRAEAVRRA